MAVMENLAVGLVIPRAPRCSEVVSSVKNDVRGVLLIEHCNNNRRKLNVVERRVPINK
jgi:hypothetical protein